MKYGKDITVMPKKQRNPTSDDWIPVHAIRKTADGGIQLLTEKGIMSNPAKRKGFLKKVERLFSAGGRKVRLALGNPRRAKGDVGHEYYIQDMDSGKVIDGPYGYMRDAKNAKDNLSYSYGGVLKIIKRGIWDSRLKIER